MQQILIRCPIPCVLLKEPSRRSEPTEPPPPPPQIVGWLVSRHGVKLHYEHARRGVTIFDEYTNLRHTRFSESHLPTPDGTVSLKTALTHASWVDHWSFYLVVATEMSVPPQWHQVPHLRDFIWSARFWGTATGTPVLRQERCKQKPRYMTLKLDLETECCICYEKLAQPSTQMSRPYKCEHYFHQSCSDRWINACIVNKSLSCCPLCRSPIEQLSDRAVQRAKCDEENV